MNTTYYCPICGKDYKHRDDEFSVDPLDLRRGTFIQNTIRHGDILIVTCWNEKCEIHGQTASIIRVASGEFTQAFQLTIQFDHETGAPK